jgi:hypothetical protein
MSEYQYYEFQALDALLTHEAQAEMHRLSSRVQLTANSAAFMYNFGDFRGDPYTVLARHFDAMLYVTNWGTRQLMFRFPAGAIPDPVRNAYHFPESLEWSTKGDYVILNIELNEEDFDGRWIEGEGRLSGLAQIRTDLMRGDYRALYLAWLQMARQELDVMEEEEDLTEPPVPPNLRVLSPALRNFIDFFTIDADLVTAAAQKSPEAGMSNEQLKAGIGQLSEEEKIVFLEKLLQGEPHLDVVLAHRLHELAGTDEAAQPASERRTLRQIEAASKIVRQRRLEAERQKAQAAHLKKLEQVAARHDQLWEQIPDLIEQKKANTYDEAVRILKDLHDLALHQQRLPDFNDRLAVLLSRYPTLQGLHKRLKAAQLVSGSRPR